MNVKKFLKSIVILSSFILVGCNNANDTSPMDGGDKPNTSDKVTVSSISISGLNDAYDIRESIDFTSGIKATVKLSNDTSVELDKYEVDIDKANKKDDTKFILSTSGLSSQTKGSMTEGNYDIKVDLIDYQLDSPYKVKTINVVNDMSRVYSLTLFEDPQNIHDYKQRVNGALQDEETSFKAKQDLYVVGDDNEFIYKPTANFTSKTTAMPITADVEITPNVYTLNTTGVDFTKGEKVESSVYTYNPKTYGFKFTNEAVGNTYRIEALPTHYTKLASDTGDIKPLVLDIKVLDGYNCYNALDLARINVVDNADLKKALKRSSEEPTNSVMNGTKEKYAADAYKGLYYDESTNTYSHDTLRNMVWEEFLKTDKQQKDVAQVNGIYFQNDISIDNSSIPSKFIISEAEAKAQSTGKTDFAKDTIRDYTYLYTHYLEGSDFYLNGNCFKLDTTKIKLGRSKTKESDNQCIIYEQNTANKQMGNSALFNFCGSIDGSSTAKAHVSNLESIGNLGDVLSLDKSSSEYQNRIDDASGSMKFIMSQHGVTEVDNVIAKYYQIGFYQEGKFSYKTMDITNSRCYDCFTSGIYNYGSLGTIQNEVVTNNSNSTSINTVTNSEFKRFGGPAVILRSIYDKDQDGSDGSKANLLGVAGLKATNSTFESFVDGSEPWFTFNSINSAVTSIMTLFEPTLNAYGKSLKFDKGIDGTPAIKMNFPILGGDKNLLNADSNTQTYIDFNNYETLDSLNTNQATFTQVTTNPNSLRQLYNTATQLGVTSTPIFRLVNQDKNNDTVGYVNAQGQIQAYKGIDPSTGKPNIQALTPYILPGDTPSITSEENKLKGDYIEALMPLSLLGVQSTADITLTLQLKDYTLPQA